jgi:hypothetical protein
MTEGEFLSALLVAKSPGGNANGVITRGAALKLMYSFLKP